MTNKGESMSKLEEAIQAIYDAVKKAEEISLETGESFSLDIAYGMGGYFDPGDEYDESHWFPSSHSC